MRNLPASLVFLSVLCFATLHAQDPPGERPEPDAERDPPRGPRFSFEELRELFDADDDGELDRAEREELREFLRDIGSPFLEPGGPGFRGPRRGRGPGRERLAVVRRFDWDGNGRLDDEERRRARDHVRSKRSGDGRRRRPRFPLGEEDSVEDGNREPERLTPADVETYPDRDLYDAGILRTLFLRFPTETWEEELADFYRTDVEVPAELIADGESYPGVGVRFRGNSSFFTVAGGKKRSLNISIDHSERDQRLHGYKTLNLLNSHADPSFLRAVLYYEIYRRYAPAPKANFVRLVINGESWGVYLNVQQYNKDLVEEWFGTRDGARWKIPANPFGAPALSYLGDDPDAYKRHFELKSAAEPERAWSDLLHLAKVLDETPPERLEVELSGRLDIDGALWFLALDNVFQDGDGYLSRGSDFVLYKDPRGRFHLLPYDSNETFGIPGGPGGRRFRGRGARRAPGEGENDRPPREAGGSPPQNDERDGARPSAGERPAGDRPDRRRRGGREPRFDQSPFLHADSEEHVLVQKLLAVPRLRARYVAHVRTLAEEALDWEVLGPIVARHRDLIDEEVAKDTRKLYSTESYADSIEEGGRTGRRSVVGIRRFVERRQEYLLSHPEIAKPRPIFLSVEHRTGKSADDAPDPSAPVTVIARLGYEVPCDEVILHHAKEEGGIFRPLRFEEGDGGIWTAELPPFPAGTRVRYYVEARAGADLGTVAFFPPNTELGALSYTVRAPEGSGFPVTVIEASQGSENGLVDPEGEHDDWIRLHNSSADEIDLSGMYLSDDPEKPRRWRFPEGSVIVPGGYLVVWADRDGDEQKDDGALHANFRLALGETVMLVDRDDRQNAILGRRRVETGVEERRPSEAPSE